MSKNIKGRNWAFVMYPESMPENWRDILYEIGLPCAVSPLHDKDLDPTGEEKKPHYHVICTYDNATTSKAVKELVTDRLNATIPIKLENLKGMYRYHLHLDNPEKYQYDDRDRQFFNGFDKSSVEKLTHTEIQKLFKEIIAFINENHIYEYCDLLTIFLDNDMPELFDVASNNTIMLTSFLTSKRNKMKDEQSRRS